MLRIKKNGFLFAALILLSATSQTQGQTNGLVPPIDTHQQDSINRLNPGPRCDQPFLPLIDDIIDRAFYQSGNDRDQPTARTCQLNAPLSFDSESNDSNCDEADSNQTTTINGWVVSKGSIPMTVTPELQIQHECFVCDLCGIETSSCETCCESCTKARRWQCAELSNSFAADGSMEQYCDQVATLLITTLNGSKDNPQAQQRAIQTAFHMVAEKSNLVARAETDKLRKSHHQSLKQILMEHARKGQPRLIAENETVLEPIYATQFRNSQRLTKLNDTNQSIMQSLLGLEKKFASFTMIQRAKLSGAEIQQMMDSLEQENAREKELQQLQAELQVLDQRIRQLQANPVKPANHLEPIYAPARPLKPMKNPYER